MIHVGIKQIAIIALLCFSFYHLFREANRFATSKAMKKRMKRLLESLTKKKDPFGNVKNFHRRCTDISSISQFCKSFTGPDWLRETDAMLIARTSPFSLHEIYEAALYLKNIEELRMVVKNAPAANLSLVSCAQLVAQSRYFGNVAGFGMTMEEAGEALNRIFNPRSSKDPEDRKE